MPFQRGQYSLQSTNETGGSLNIRFARSEYWSNNISCSDAQGCREPSVIDVMGFNCGQTICFRMLALIPHSLFNLLALISDKLVGCMRKYVCTLYSSTNDDINKARYSLFCNPARKATASKSSLYTTHKRVNYQTCIRNQCLDPMMQLPSPKEHDWIENMEGYAWISSHTALTKSQHVETLDSHVTNYNSSVHHSVYA